MTLVQLAALFGVHKKTNHSVGKRGVEQPRADAGKKDLSERALSKAAAENA
jgi:hypothetical protein